MTVTPCFPLNRRLSENRIGDRPIACTPGGVGPGRVHGARQIR